MAYRPHANSSSNNSNSTSLVKAGNQAAQTQAYHIGSQVWIPERSQQLGPDGKPRPARWVKGTVVAVQTDPAGTAVVEVETEEGAKHTMPAVECPLQNERDDTVDDLVRSDFLHEPGYAVCMSCQNREACQSDR